MMRTGCILQAEIVNLGKFCFILCSFALLLILTRMLALTLVETRHNVALS